MEVDPRTETSTPGPLPEHLCVGCHKSMELTDHFCRHCGLKQDKEVPLLQQRWVVLSMLFLVIGPFATPMLWRNPHFSRTEKIVLTVGSLVVTIGLLVGTIWLSLFLYQMVIDQIDITMNFPAESLHGLFADTGLPKLWD